MFHLVNSQQAGIAMPDHSLSGPVLERNPIDAAEETAQFTGSRHQQVGADNTNPSSGKPTKDSVQLSEEAREIAQLVARDREVRAHEAAHAAAGGRYAGSPSLTYRKGPDGRSYASGGEVPIDVSPISGDPQASLQKAQIVRAAALAPAQPSSQDMRIAARASAMAANARAELAQQTSADPESSSVGKESDAVCPDESQTGEVAGRTSVQSRGESGQLFRTTA